MSPIRGQGFPLSRNMVGCHISWYIICQDIGLPFVRVYCCHLSLYRVVICQGIWLVISYDCISLVVICQGIDLTVIFCRVVSCHGIGLVFICQATGLSSVRV